MGNTGLYVVENLSNHTGIRIIGVRNTLGPPIVSCDLRFKLITDLKNGDIPPNFPQIWQFFFT